MPEVTFYVLQSQSQQERQAFACKLVEKIYRSGRSCFVLTDSDQQSRQLDDVLWTFRPGSFVPHQIFKDELPLFPHTVLIGSDAIPQQWQDVIVNLAAHPPRHDERCRRILEILDDREETKQAGRTRYRHYRQAGLEISTHRM